MITSIFVRFFALFSIALADKLMFLIRFVLSIFCYVAHKEVVVFLSSTFLVTVKKYFENISETGICNFFAIRNFYYNILVSLLFKSMTLDLYRSCFLISKKIPVLGF